MTEDFEKIIPIPEGRYDSLVTARLQSQMEAFAHVLDFRKRVLEPVKKNDQGKQQLVIDALQRHLFSRLEDELAARDFPDRLVLLNQLISVVDDSGFVSDSLAKPLTKLTSVAGRTALHKKPQHRVETLLPLHHEDLIINGPREYSLNEHLRSEMDSADSIDLLCAFIKFSGISVLEDRLAAARRRGIPIRVLTTTYLGATDQKALDELVQRFGAEVRINYETHSTRLHAKAWLFSRNSGFHTGYVGSSNLSYDALVDGLEWNVRLAEGPSKDLLDKFRFTFESYWDDPRFEQYDPEADGDRLALHLFEAGGREKPSVLKMDLRRKSEAERARLRSIEPYSHQRKILAALQFERDRGIDRNLVVAATGTGKTVVAALDYRRLCEQAGRRLRLLFVAHRSEILHQAQRTFATVMADATFGERFVGGQRPERWEHVFASVQSLNTVLSPLEADESLPSWGLGELSRDHFDVVIVDEFHHAEAPSYRRLLDFLRPQQLLGITATPERADGVNVADEYFDGEYAFEIRLWDAIEEGYLVPFHYYGIADDTDLRLLRFRRGSYDIEELEKLYTGNDARVNLILRQLDRKIVDPQSMKALGFCVSVAHARYMAAKFENAGIPSAFVSGETSLEDRGEILRMLSSGDINCIFSVDVFNEGLDIPDVDTILLLRPTQSATIFLQQIGRGLRHAPGKGLLTVLDFIGQQHEGFRFETKLAALLETTTRKLEQQIKTDTVLLPSGCNFHLDEVAAQHILKNIRKSLDTMSILREVRQHRTTKLADFLRASGYQRDEIYREKQNQKAARTWTALLNEAGLLEPIDARVMVETLPTPFQGLDHDALEAIESELLSSMRHFQLVTDPARVSGYRRLMRADAAPYPQLSTEDQRIARMLFYVFFRKPSLRSLRDNGLNWTLTDYETGLMLIRSFREVCAEATQLLELAEEDSQWPVRKVLDENGADLGFYANTYYSRREVLAALDHGAKAPKAIEHREGVHWSKERGIDAFFVTLDKKKESHSETTMYRDYAINRELFHWQSQSTTSEGSPAGQRYITGAEAGAKARQLLFVRHREGDEFGNKGSPYVCLGLLSYVNHQGSRPISFTWRLETPMPEDLYQVATAHALAYAAV